MVDGLVVPAEPAQLEPTQLVAIAMPTRSPSSGTREGPAVQIERFGDAKDRYADAKSRKNYAGTASITRQSGKSKTLHARFVHNDRLVDAL